MIQGATANSYGRRESDPTGLILAGGIAVTLLLALLMVRAAASGGSYMAALMVLAALAVLPCVWRWPQLSVYVLLGAAAFAEETTGFGPFDSLPLFRDLQASTGLPGMAFNPMELLTVLGIGVALLKGRSLGRPMLGPLILPFLLLVGFLVYGFLRGHAVGGDLKIAFWGVRGLTLMFMAYLLTVNVVRDRGQVRVLFLVLMAGVILKALYGLYRLVFELHGRLSNLEVSRTNGAVNALLSHEDSFFFLALMFMCLLAYVYQVRKSDQRFCLMGLLIALIPFLANQRRAAIAALVLAGIVLVILMLNRGMLRPRTLVWFGLVAAAVLPLYGAVLWNSQSPAALPVQAVKSAFEPDRRDASSNMYREIENENLRYTAVHNRSKLLGIGFGRQMVQAERLPDIGNIYRWYLFLPHNGLLWLGMTIGVTGLAAFAYLMASAVMQSVSAIKTNEDAWLKAVFTLGLMMIAVYVTLVMLDQGIHSQRIGAFMGIQLGLLSLAARDLRQRRNTASRTALSLSGDRT